MGSVLHAFQPILSLMPPVSIPPFKASTAIFAVVAIVAIILLYLSVDPSDAYFPRCAFKTFTGLECPGCGSQRAFHSLLNGNFREAVRFNALFVAELPLLLLLTVAWFTRKRMPRFQQALSSRFFILAILTSIIIWTIVRNIFDV